MAYLPRLKRCAREWEIFPKIISHDIVASPLHSIATKEVQDLCMSRSMRPLEKPYIPSNVIRPPECGVRLERFMAYGGSCIIRVSVGPPLYPFIKIISISALLFSICRER